MTRRVRTRSDSRGGPTLPMGHAPPWHCPHLPLILSDPRPVRHERKGSHPLSGGPQCPGRALATVRAPQRVTGSPSSKPVAKAERSWAGGVHSPDTAQAQTLLREPRPPGASLAWDPRGSQELSRPLCPNPLRPGRPAALAKAPGQPSPDRPRLMTLGVSRPCASPGFPPLGQASRSRTAIENGSSVLIL